MIFIQDGCSSHLKLQLRSLGEDVPSLLSHFSHWARPMYSSHSIGIRKTAYSLSPRPLQRCSLALVCGNIALPESNGFAFDEQSEPGCFSAFLPILWLGTSPWSCPSSHISLTLLARSASLASILSRLFSEACSFHSLVLSWWVGWRCSWVPSWAQVWCFCYAVRTPSSNMLKANHKTIHRYSPCEHGQTFR